MRVILSFIFLFFLINNSFAACDQGSNLDDDDNRMPRSVSHCMNFDQMFELSKIAVAGKDIKCIVIYAWNECYNHPYNVFARKISDTLKRAGINMYLDLNNLNVGDVVEDYVQKISDPNYFVILLITPLVAERCKIQELDLKPGEKLPWIKKEVMKVAERLKRKSFFYIPVLLNNSDADKHANSFITQLFNEHIRKEKPDHRDQEYLYKDFTDESQYYNNILEILTRKLALAPHAAEGLSSPILIRKDSHSYGNLSFTRRAHDFFVDRVKPNIFPMFVLFVSIYLGSNYLKNGSLK